MHFPSETSAEYVHDAVYLRPKILHGEWNSADDILVYLYAIPKKNCSKKRRVRDFNITQSIVCIHVFHHDDFGSLPTHL